MPASTIETNVHNFMQMSDLSMSWKYFDADHLRLSVEAEAINNYARNVLNGTVSAGDVRSYFRQEYRRLFLANGMSKERVYDYMGTDPSVDQMQEVAKQFEDERRKDADVSAHRHQQNMLYGLYMMIDIPENGDLNQYMEMTDALLHHQADKTDDLRAFIRDGYQKILISYGWNEKAVQLLMATNPHGLHSIMMDIVADPSHCYSGYWRGYDVEGDFQAMRGMMEGQSVEGDEQAELAVMEGQLKSMRDMYP